MNFKQLLPVLFVSHGAPDILLSTDENNSAIRNLSKRVPAPKAIVVVSAHWIDDPVGITDSEQLETIHDFGGFQPELYQQTYTARGNADMSRRVSSLLQDKGIETKCHYNRGLDHGAWIPLSLMYPDADIPVVQVSLPTSPLDDLVTMGEALKPLRDEGVLIIASGGTVHNLREVKLSEGPDQWAVEFEEWIREVIEGNRFSDLINVEKYPSNFRHAHPSIEHFAPLIVAWSAGGHTHPGKRLNYGFCYGNIGMSHYLFGAEVDTPMLDTFSG